LEHCGSKLPHSIEPNELFSGILRCNGFCDGGEDMKILKIIGFILILCGLIMLLVSGITFFNARNFARDSVVTTGTVVDLVLEDSMSDDSGPFYHPVVSFITTDGETVEFKASYGSNPPRYSRGDEIKVRYDRYNPYKARLDSFFDLWGIAIIFGAIGLAMIDAGITMLVVSALSARKEKWLRESGKAITTEFLAVEVNTSVRVNNRHPYQIVSQWLDSEANKVYVFKSKNIWFNPEEFIQSSEIRVLIDPNNPKKYFMDTSFLPESAS
jgi:hypothetical protein